MTHVRDAYDALLLDLDGTVWEGGDAIPHAVDNINGFGRPAIYVTNNASRAAREVADMLARIGLHTDPTHVLTSAAAAVMLLAEEGIAPGAPVLVLGSDSFIDLVRDAGYRPVTSADDKPAAVLHGHNPHTGWAQLSEAALAIRAGATYLASNLDTSLPQQRGLMVGNGAMVAAVATSTGVTPRSAGKPQPAMFHLAADALHSTSPLAVGDRLDTDIAGGVAAGMDTLHVMTGVSRAVDLFHAPAEHRPTLLAADLRALGADTDTLTPGDQEGWTATREADTVILSGEHTGDDPMAIVRTILGAAWSQPTPPQHITFPHSAAEKAWQQWT